MTTVTGFTAERMLAIEDGTVVDGEIRGTDLILVKHDGSEINAGPVTGPAGPVGPTGPGGGFIPGEVRLWPGSVLPEVGSYGTWVWADGAYYPVSAHPLAAGHIAAEWRTFGGASDPGGANFRVPDLRGLVAAGLDAMPGGARANRMTRVVAITIASKTGEETHKIVTAEMPAHSHSINGVGDHQHTDNFHTAVMGQAGSSGAQGGVVVGLNNPGALTGAAGAHSHGAGNTGGNGSHENVQPTVFVPYIVCLDG